MLPLNDKSFLVHHQDGHVYLAYGAHLYARAEMVPFDIIDGPLPEKVPTADAYVRLCVAETFGTDTQIWPPLARRFLNLDMT